MSNESRASENEAVKRALESSYCPASIKDARERQDKWMSERLQAGPYTIADVGCGNGYHAVMLAPVLALYHGFELSTAIAETARELWRKVGMDKAEIIVGDIADAELKDEIYDVVLCMYFTPGNFRDISDDFSLYTDDYLDRNPQFIGMVSRFHRAMKKGGSMFLTVYKDVPEAEAAQWDYYKNTGQHVVTPTGSRFAATSEGFWSARWTKRSLLSNLDACGIKPDDVVFNDLNEISWLVEITK